MFPEKISKQELQLEQLIWNKVSWTFTIKPSGAYKDCTIKAEWPKSGLDDGYTTIFSTRDAGKMTDMEWVFWNQQNMINNIITKLEVKYKDLNGFYINGEWFPYNSTTTN